MLVRSSILLCLVVSLVLSQEERISSQDHPELEKLFELDQKIRSGFLDATPDQLTEMRKADSDRRSRVLELYNSGMLKTENDYYRAAMIFQHGVEPDHYLFAHELAVASLALGNQNARWLAAATEDRFLKSLGRKQRFGTQFEKSGDNQKWKLYDMDEHVNDSLRAVLNCPLRAGIEHLLNQLNDGTLPAPTIRRR